ncbi:HEXXH motif-containing protein [Kibdelosporangium banguiense]|uniref:HEXXH motif-containing protein n=1 Tax=Kibdelosporangium banguiense TaxID=1365924 RepID=A0ABS4T9V7_9PSEU|nr:HEXXH motif domain-containing protein [Kibdelosporangium banguiense]MBP2320621.1 HEXXH motif-containing protein [Kibdelosporangium banguiense]
MQRLGQLIVDDAPPDAFPRHHISWHDFDAMAKGSGGARVVRQLRRAERSRRLLLLRSLVDQVAKSPELADPLPSPVDAWDLLARVEQAAPTVLDLVLAHPYTGSWAGYTTRLLTQKISGVWPLWVHIGYVNALAAAAAIRAGIRFDIRIPAWQGEAILPTLGLVRLDCCDTAEIHGSPDGVEVRYGTGTIRLPTDLSTDTDEWWSIRRLVTRANGRTFSVRLDDLDPYRGPHEPLGPQRLPESETIAWQGLMSHAWRLIADGLPDFAEALRVGFDSVAPRPLTLFRAPSASSSDAFGSAIINRPADPASLASMLVHEFQHSRLTGLMHLTRLWENDPRERLYAPWRDDPRPIGGVFQGLYAFFGMTAFWRAQMRCGDRRGSFEFAYHREVAWRTVSAVRHDPALTPTGRRFVNAIAEELQPWLTEPIATDMIEAAARTAKDHYLGWRLRHVRPDSALVCDLAKAWLDGSPTSPFEAGTDQPPTPVPDGGWSHARADLTQLLVTKGMSSWLTVAGATHADLALVTGRFPDAIRGFRAELAEDPDRPASITGLTLALSAVDSSPATRILLRCPELVRAVHRAVREHTTQAITVDGLAEWLGQTVL